jgi:hypothetical protein
VRVSFFPSRAGWPRRQRPRRRRAPITRSSFSRAVPSERDEICGALFQAAHAGVFPLLCRAGCQAGVVVVAVYQRDAVDVVPDAGGFVSWDSFSSVRRLGRKVECAGSAGVRVGGCARDRAEMGEWLASFWVLPLRSDETRRHPQGAGDR